MPQGSRDHFIVEHTIKIKFNLDVDSTNKTSSIAKNVGRTLLKKRC